MRIITMAQICRKRLKHILAFVLLVSLIFILYQALIFIQLSNEITSLEDAVKIRGIHPKMRNFYVKSYDYFTCIYTSEVIVFDRVNDDYCDCQDGTDEPGTNACPNGDFYCEYQGKYKNYRNKIPSNRVNDGVCDCCDGSDEWILKTHLIRQNRGELVQRKIGTPCPKLC